jgi:hypothetical protein
MTARTVEAQGVEVRTLQIDACASCSVFWFDTAESIRVTPSAVIGLFRYIGTSATAYRPLAGALACPRCHRTLAFTHDLTLTTRFTYWRCLAGDGRLITSHCGAPITLIDPQSVAKALQDSSNA